MAERPIDSPSQSEKAHLTRLVSGQLPVVVRLGFSATIVGWILWRTDWSQMTAIVSKADFRLLLLSLVLVLMGTFLQGARWWILLTGAGSPWPFVKIQLVHFTSLFHDFYTPGRLGSDGFKLLCLRRLGAGTHIVVSSLLVLRFQGLVVALGVVGLAALLILTPGGWEYLAATVYVVIVAVAFYLLARFRVLPERIEWNGNGRRSGWIGTATMHLAKVASAANRMAQNRMTLQLSSGVALLFLFTAVAVYVSAGLAFGASIGLVNYIMVVPLMMLSTLVPVTFQGRGLSELIALSLWQGPDASQEQVILICVTVYFALVLQGLMSGVLWTSLRPTSWHARIFGEKESSNDTHGVDP